MATGIDDRDGHGDTKLLGFLDCGG
jgi:hypothetical protein